MFKRILRGNIETALRESGYEYQTTWCGINAWIRKQDDCECEVNVYLLELTLRPTEGGRIHRRYDKVKNFANALVMYGCLTSESLKKALLNL